MVAANPERSSWTSEEVRGNLTPIWVRPIDPYIHYKFQIITSYGKLFISSARGLYAINADNGNIDWVYPTELPLGNSPTISNGIVYVGGHDKKIHAIDALTGQKIPTWNFYEAGAGFESNPIVLNNTVYAGNRDGFFYALNAITGKLTWKFQTGGSIPYSAAHKNGVLYFASNDSYAYAIKAVPDNPNNQDGQLVWKSAKLQGAGFYSYWPVIYTNKLTQKDYIIFSGSANFQNYNDLINLDLFDLFPKHATDPWGTLIGSLGTVSGDWVPGTVTIDVSKITNYLEQKPTRRIVYMLNAQNGQEYTFDSNGNGQQEFVPFTYAGVSHNGNKYPPIIGKDGVLYQFANYMSAPWITRGQIAGWKFGTHFISRVADNDTAIDEPMAFSSGGNLIYYSLCCDRTSGAFDITMPYGQANRSWTYFDYNIRTRIPNYQPKYYGNDMNGWGLFGNVNGIYGKHGTQNPPIPYRGKLFMQKGNSIIAFSRNVSNPQILPIAASLNIGKSNPQISQNMLLQKLEVEVQKIVNDPNSFLRPGYYGTGFFRCGANGIDGDKFTDYFHNPSDTIYTLIQTLPYLSPTVQQQTRTYLQQFINQFPLNNIVYVGWKDGLSREVFDIPPEIASNYTYGPLTNSSSGTWWQNFPPNSFYGAWKYAQIFGGAKLNFDPMKAKLETPPNDNYLIQKPYILNAYIAGYWGYLELEKLAAYTEEPNIRATLNHLLDLRVTNFSKNSIYTVSDTTEGEGWTSVNYNRAMNVCRNFMYMVPELGNYLHDYAFAKVQTAINEYVNVAPYWFVTKFDASTGETVFQHLFDYDAIFKAKAYIIRESREELAKYLDVPSFEKGDLFYIQNLVATIQAPSSLP